MGQGGTDGGREREGARMTSGGLPVTGAGVMGPLCDGKTQEYEWG